MAALPVEVLLGVYLGVLTGIIPAFVAWGLGFIFRYITGLAIPGFAVVGLGVAIAGLSGGVLALNDPTVRAAPVSVTVGVLVVLMMTLYSHNLGDKMGTTFPHRVSFRSLRERTLSADVVERIGGRGQVRVSVTGEVGDIEGYPPLPADIRTAIREGEWLFDADLPLAELERAFAERLRSEFDLEEVTVQIDERGRATVAAAPPMSGLSRRLGSGERAVSVNGLLPAGLAQGDRVRIEADGTTVEAPVVSAGSGAGAGSQGGPGKPSTAAAAAGSPSSTDAGEGESEKPVVEPQRSVPTTPGGEGRITVAVDRGTAQSLLGADRARITVRSRGNRREFELISLLRRGGKRFRRVSVRAGGPLDGTTLGAAGVRDTYGVAVLAVRGPEGWRLAPRGPTPISGGDDLLVAGARDALDRFQETVGGTNP